MVVHTSMENDMLMQRAVVVLRHYMLLYRAKVEVRVGGHLAVIVGTSEVRHRLRGEAR